MKFTWMLKAAAVALAVVAGLTAFTLLLWNNLVPTLFHGPELNFWQALGLLVLSRILLGGLPFRRRGWGPGHGNWRQRWHQRWDQLTPAEREQYRQRYAGRCRPHSQPAPAAPAPSTPTAV